MSFPRAKDTSHELTQMRTVLSRARTARKQIEDAYEYVRPEFLNHGTGPDKDAKEMIYDLDRAIAILQKWGRS